MVGRPRKGDLVSITVRIDRDAAAAIDARGEARSAFVRVAIAERLGRGSAVVAGVQKVAAAEDLSRRAEVGIQRMERDWYAAHKKRLAEKAAERGARGSDSPLFALVCRRPGISERAAARELGWMEGRVSKEARELTDAGLIWFPSAGCMEAVE